MKTCTKCKQSKPLASFEAHRTCAGGRHTQCRDCLNAAERARKALDPERWNRRNREFNRKNPLKHSTYTHRHRIALRISALVAYSGDTPECACCHEKRIAFLTIDHINGGGGKHKREIGSKLYTWLKQRGYPDGFRVLCFNCNIARGLYGCCPHEDPSSGHIEPSKAKFRRNTHKDGRVEVLEDYELLMPGEGL